MKKTNAVRILDGLGINYRLLEYEFDPDDLGAEHVAQTLGMDAGKIFKTICLFNELGGYLFACLPGDKHLDLKKLAKFSNHKRVELLPTEKLFNLTGYRRGGVSPLGAKKCLPVYLDESAFLHDTISVSAGIRGMQVILSPEDLVRATNALTGNILLPE